MLGLFGALGGAAVTSRAAAAVSSGTPNPHGDEHSDHSDGGAHAHGDAGVVGRVDHARNGFDPQQLLTEFDWGTVSRDAAGRTVREYRLVATAKDIEVAPGVMFPAWVYNGRVPGPTIRAVEGDIMRVTLVNESEHQHSLHFHGFHVASMDGVPGALEAAPGTSVTYEFTAEPFGVHLYHCHSLPFRTHMARGLYGAFIVDPKAGRPAANEMVMVLNGFDTDFDGENEVYAVNTVAFAYADQPIRIRAGELQRVYVVNLTEFDPINSIHTHATFFYLYRTGTSLTPHELTDTISMCQGERHLLEFRYRDAGTYMFHAHQAEFADLGWTGMFEVS